MNIATKSNVFAQASNGDNTQTGNQGNNRNISQRSHCLPVRQAGPVQAEPGSTFFSKRIGATTYRVGIHFNPGGSETLQDKIMRIVRNDLNPSPIRATMGLPQTGGTLERGSQ